MQSVVIVDWDTECVQERELLLLRGLALGCPALKKKSFGGTSVACSAEFDKALGVIAVELPSSFGGEAVPYRYWYRQLLGKQ